MLLILIALVIIGILASISLILSLVLRHTISRKGIVNETGARAELFLLPRKIEFDPKKKIVVEAERMIIGEKPVEFGWVGAIYEINDYSITDLLKRNKPEPRPKLIASKNPRDVQFDVKVEIVQADTLDERVKEYSDYVFVIVDDTREAVAAFLAEAIPLISSRWTNAGSEMSDFNPKTYASVKEFPFSPEKVLRMRSTAPLDSIEVFLKRHRALIDEIYSVVNVGTYERLTDWKPRGADYIIINLGTHKFRLDRIEKQFENSNMTFERFPAIDGKRFVDQLKNKVSWKEFYPMRAGQLGCYLSHLEILYNLVHEPSDKDFYTILEDDAVFKREIPDPKEIVRRAPSNWDMIFLGVHEKFCKYRGDSEYIKMTKKCMPTTFAYIVRRRAAIYFVDFFQPVEIPIDNVYRDESEWLNIYIANPEFAYQTSGRGSTTSV
jgi:GR25 family glycosyltransferase involved in LPS biosynthesis